MVRETDRKEIRRYLGYYGKKADETIEGQISICLEEMCLAAEPKAVFRRCGLICREDGRILITALPEDRVRGTLMEVTSKSLAKNLHGCCGVYLMAVTDLVGIISRESVRATPISFFISRALSKSFCRVRGRSP